MGLNNTTELSINLGAKNKTNKTRKDIKENTTFLLLKEKSFSLDCFQKIKKANKETINQATLKPIIINAQK